VTGRPLVPVGRAVRLVLMAATASRSLLAAAFAWFLVLAAVYAADAGPPLPAMAVTASALLPVASWAAAATLGATSDDLRALVVAADGRPRMLLVDAVVPGLMVAGAALLGVVAPLLFDPHPLSARDALLGATLHLLCGAVGVGLALLLRALALARGTQALIVVAATVASGRLAWLPPDGPVLAGWGAERDPSAALAGWALAGPVVVTAALLAGTAALRRRRS
jgi:hypothetical protein